VFALTITTLVLGLAAGIFLAVRFLPPLADGRDGQIATWVVRVLIGCAVAWAAEQIYFGIHTYATGNIREAAESASFDKSSVLTGTVQSILLIDSLLIGFAGAIYLLGPPQRQAPKPASSSAHPTPE
jgi:ABC-type xylose transport system permease subunit